MSIFTAIVRTYLGYYVLRISKHILLLELIEPGGITHCGGYNGMVAGVF
jgi:hypothetical protein